MTAEGVFRGIQFCVRRKLDRELDGITVGIQGVGHVGGFLAEKLHAAGARLVITDINAEVLDSVSQATGAQVVAPDAIFDAEAEVFAPCALGGAVNAQTLPRLKATIVAGGANNQIADPATGQAMFEAGVLYAPDYMINGGGIINIAGEIRALEAGEAFDPAWVEGKVVQMIETLGEVLDQAAQESRPSQDVADGIARARIRAAAESKVGA